MDPEWMNALNVFTIAALYIQMTLCLILNTISITFMIYSKMFSPINILIMNLAIADILYASCVPYYVRQFGEGTSSQSKFGCRITFILDVTCMIVNVFTVSALTIERYTCLKEKTLNPNDNCRKKVILIYILVLWMVATGFSLPKALSIIERDMKINNGTETITVCDSTFDQLHDEIYTMLKWILAFLLPYSSIIFFSCCLLKFLKDWSNRTKKFHLKEKRKTNSPTNGNSNEGQQQKLIIPEPETKKLPIIEVENQQLVDLNSPKSRKQKPMMEHKKGSFDADAAPNSPRNQTCSTVIASERPTQDMTVKHVSKPPRPHNPQVLTAAKKASRQSVIKKRTTRFVLAVVISFLCAWSPFWIFQIVVTFTESFSQYLQIARNLTLIAVYFEGVTNPLLFLILTENFRDFVFTKVCYFLKRA